MLAVQVFTLAALAAVGLAASDRGAFSINNMDEIIIFIETIVKHYVALYQILMICISTIVKHYIALYRILIGF